MVRLYPVRSGEHGTFTQYFWIIQFNSNKKTIFEFFIFIFIFEFDYFWMSIEIQCMTEKLIVIIIKLDYSKVPSKSTAVLLSIAVPTIACSWRVDNDYAKGGIMIIITQMALMARSANDQLGGTTERRYIKKILKNAKLSHGGCHFDQ